MRRLARAFAGRTYHIVGDLMSRLKNIENEKKTSILKTFRNASIFAECFNFWYPAVSPLPNYLLTYAFGIIKGELNLREIIAPKALSFGISFEISFHVVVLAGQCSEYFVLILSFYDTYTPTKQ